MATPNEDTRMTDRLTTADVVALLRGIRSDIEGAIKRAWLADGDAGPRIVPMLARLDAATDALAAQGDGLCAIAGCPDDGALVPFARFHLCEGHYVDVLRYQEETAAASGAGTGDAAQGDDTARLVEALRPFATFWHQWSRMPIHSLDDEFYGIHNGTEYEASLRRSDCKRAADAIAAIDTARNA